MPEQPPSNDHGEMNPWNEPPDPPEGEVSPSVAFMEMMRRAAARSAQEAVPAEPDRQDPSPEPSWQPVPPAIPETTANSSIDEAPVGEAEEEQERLPRSRRRSARQSNTTALGGCLRSLIIALTAAVLAATIFTWATPNEFIAINVRRGLSAAIATEAATAEPTLVATPNWLRRIGIVSGHRGPENDPGAVCPDGLTEAEINLSVAQRVVALLQSRGYAVDLLDEFDPRLANYRADALVSIHANTCQDFGEAVSGFLISFPAARISARGNDALLVDCIAVRYAAETALERRMELTRDMTEYHTFNEIHPLTPAAIIELGFMLGDRQLLTEQPDIMAAAISDGVVCFLEPTAVN
ncbi:MAG: N-acetylmuramoyl-L-alanine amidase [Anaerolineae bacterium]|nr:N-acetylmuramoyl-L-alanine amidase [Anaerolineae bacterium]NUQ03194.1 N-acetylmuramoyl-L-alanine amidase [Anaerolineae bacterium]